MGKLGNIALGLLAAYLLLTFCAFKFFGFLGLVGMFIFTVLGAIAGKKLLGVALKKAFLLPFKAKGAVLASAAAHVHSISPAPEPTGSPMSDEDDEEHTEFKAGLRWYILDVTISPKGRKSSNEQGFSMWEPGELCVVPYGVTGAAIMNEEFDEEDSCVIASRMIWNGSDFTVDEGMKFEGEVRMKLHVGVMPEIQSVAFQYYFEVFGEVKMNSSTSPSEPRLPSPSKESMLHH